MVVLVVLMVLMVPSTLDLELIQFPTTLSPTQQPFPSALFFFFSFSAFSDGVFFFLFLQIYFTFPTPSQTSTASGTNPIVALGKKKEISPKKGTVFGSFCRHAIEFFEKHTQKPMISAALVSPTGRHPEAWEQKTAVDSTSNDSPSTPRRQRREKEGAF